MIKKSIYPKTIRLSCSGENVEITEKLDGSNMCIFKKDDMLYIALRKNILTFDELSENKDVLYKGLLGWAEENKRDLSTIRNNSVICGEWIGMGKLKYPVDEINKKFYMYAKANIDDEFNLHNIYYNHDLFKYPFNDELIPSCIGIVPTVEISKTYPTKEYLDGLYERYTKEKGRNVEGFVINHNNNIRKYVRMKNGKLSEHFDRE